MSYQNYNDYQDYIQQVVAMIWNKDCLWGVALLKGLALYMLINSIGRDICKMNCLFGQIWKEGKDVKAENVSDGVPDLIEKETEKSNATEKIKKRSIAVTRPHKSDFCWSCHRSDKSLLKCAGCRRARYCGEDCYREDWGRHGEWCGRRREKREKKKIVEKRRQEKRSWRKSIECFKVNDEVD